ncbi:MAG: LuxR C-terminal-related transcriptional regulator [Oscillospiraceae bacterium]|nr:LuxR C-terminal-related transcriptional regulator [Oscillospiraceae bacterium]
MKLTSPTTEKETRGRLKDFSIPMLLCFAALWLLTNGVASPSGKALWELGGSNYFISSKIGLPMIGAAYAVIFAVLLFLPKLVVRFTRLNAVMTLLCGTALMLPFEKPAIMGDALPIAYNFFHDLMGGAFCFVIVHYFSEKSAVKLATVIAAGVNLLCGFLQFCVQFNEEAGTQIAASLIPPEVYRAGMILCPFLLLLFFFRLPVRTDFDFDRWPSGRVYPKKLFAGTYFLIFLSYLVFYLGNGYAWLAPTGCLIVFYIAEACAGLLMYFLWKKKGISPIRLSKFFLAANSLGFIVAIAAEYVPAADYLACTLLGFTGIMGLPALFAITLHKSRPSRWIVPVIFVLSAAASFARVGLATAFMPYKELFAVTQLVVAVSATVIYFLLEPYLTFGFGKQSAKPQSAQTPVFLSQSWRELLQTNAYEPLSEGELDVAGLIMQGFQSDEIAKELTYSAGTVKTYRRRIYSKLQIHTPKELFARAQRVITDEDMEVR